MKVLDVFSWLPAKEISIEELEQIFIGHLNGAYEGEYKVLLEMPDNADKNILDSSARLIEEGKDVAYILKGGKIIAVVGYKEEAEHIGVRDGNTTQPPIPNTTQRNGRLPRFPEDWGIGEQELNFGMGETDMGKGVGNVSIIGGADGPTSIFIAGKGGKVKLSTRIQNYFRKIKRNRIKRRITANPHTLQEVVELLKREYGAVEVSQKSHNYQEQRKNLKASLIMRHRPDLLGELMDLELQEGEDMESLKAFWEQTQERERRVMEIADDIFPMDFHIYEIRCPGNGMMQVSVETVWQKLDGSCSGDKKTMKQLKKLFKKIYLYYGVTAEDIKNETERYKSLLGALCS